MNIFVLDLNPKKCAEYHIDKHSTKMCVEYAQLLCGVHWVEGGEAPYKLSHKNHPCSIWARECTENYIWLCDLGLSLCEEYTYRYGKRHKSQDVIEWCLVNKPGLKDNGDITPFALAMPDECKTKTAVESYRLYYLTHKRDISTWKERKKPEWFI
jgi:phage tail protein X